MPTAMQLAIERAAWQYERDAMERGELNCHTAPDRRMNSEGILRILPRTRCRRAINDSETKALPGERPRRTGHRTSRAEKGFQSGLRLGAAPGLPRLTRSDRCNARICGIRSSAFRIDLRPAPAALWQAEPASVPGWPEQECRAARCRRLHRWGRSRIRFSNWRSARYDSGLSIDRGRATRWTLVAGRLGPPMTCQ